MDCNRGRGIIWVCDQPCDHKVRNPAIAEVVANASPTVGGAVVQIYGDNFGIGDGNASPVSAFYGNLEDPQSFWYVAQNCQVTTPHTEIQCLTRPGIGKDLHWVVKVEDQGSAVSVDSTRYLAPSLNFVTFVSGRGRLLTVGGEIMTIYGENFGPLGSPVSIRYGPADYLPLIYRASNCEVVEAHFAISCTSAPGVGGNLVMQIEIAGQISPFSNFTLSYEDPVINRVYGPGAVNGNTNGGQLIYIDGENLGLKCSTSETGVGDCETSSERTFVVRAFYGRRPENQRARAVQEKTRENSTDVTVLPDPPPCIFDCSMFDSITTGEVDDCSVTSAWVGDACLEDCSIEAVDTFYAINTMFCDGSSAGSYGVFEFEDTDTGAPTPVPTRAPTPPPTTAVPTASPTASPTVYVYQHEYYAFEALQCSVTQAHKQISCITAEGTGFDHSWVIVIGGLFSDDFDAQTSYAPPVVSVYEGIGSVDSPTLGREVVRIRGKHFGSSSRERIDSVTYGPGGEEYIATDCFITEDHVTIECLNVEGAGKEHSWKVVIDGQVSERATTNYGKPEIHTFSGPGSAYASTDGGETVMIHGRNFGPADADYLSVVQYAYGAYKAANCTVVGNEHDLIHCLTVPGVGSDIQWGITVEGQESELSLNTTSYAPPKIQRVSPAGLLFDEMGAHPPCAHTLTFSIDAIVYDLPDPPICALDCSMSEFVGEGDADDCAIVSSWSNDACLGDCFPEDLQVLESITNMLCRGESEYFGSDGSIPDSLELDLLSVGVRLNKQYGKVVDTRFVKSNPNVGEVKTYELVLAPDIHDHASLHDDLDGASVSIILVSGEVGREEVVAQEQMPLDFLLRASPASVHTVVYEGTGAIVTFRVRFASSASTCDLFTRGGAVRVVGDNFGINDPKAHQFVRFGSRGELLSTRRIKAGTAESTTLQHEIEVILPAGIGLGHDMMVLTCRGLNAYDSSCVNEYSQSNTISLDYADPHIRSLNTLEKVVDGLVQQDVLDILIVGSNFAEEGTVFLMDKFGDTWHEAVIRADEEGVPKYQDNRIEIESPFSSGFVKVRVGKQERFVKKKKPWLP